MKHATLALALAGCAWISPADQARRWDVDQDGVRRPEDCDDGDAGISPRAPERCDARGEDEDCDGLADEADPDCRSPDDPTDPTDPTDPGDPCGPLPIAVLAVSAPAGEQGLTEFGFDASGSVGTELAYRFDLGDGPIDGGPTASAVFDVPGWHRVTVEITDGCDRTAAAEAYVAVSAPGQLLWVDTAADEDDPEVLASAPDWTGDGLSLREALGIARDTEGTQVVAFVSDLGPVTVGDRTPALSDPGGILVGRETPLVGEGPGRIEVSGSGAVASGLVLTGFDGPEGALLVTGADVVLYGVEVRDGHRALTVRGPRARIASSAFVGNGNPQVEIASEDAELVDVEVSDGDGEGIRVKGEASGVSLVSCLVRGNRDAGVLLDKTRDAAVLDSTLVDNDGDGLQSKDAEDLDLRNVVLAGNGGFGLGGKVKRFVAGSPSHDAWFGNARGDCAECSSLGEGALEVDPQLDASGAPLPGSSLIDAGIETGTDRNGPSEGSWFGDGPDIGAFETR